MKYLLALLAFLAIPAFAQPAQVSTSSQLIVQTVANTATTYNAGTLIGASKLTLSNSFRAGVPSGRIVSLVMSDLDALGKNATLIVFCSDPAATTFSNAVSFDVADADVGKICCRASLTTHQAFADNAIITAEPGCAVKNTASQDTLYAALIAAESTTWTTASAITLNIGIAQD